MSPVCNTSQWNTNSPIATSTTATGKIFQNMSNVRSVTALVIGTGPVNVIERPKLFTPRSSCSFVSSPQMHSPSSTTG